MKSGAGSSARNGVWVVKVQAPLDNSSDARGGIGRMTPATVLLHDKSLTYVRLLTEDESGHTAVLRCALRMPGQVAFCFAEEQRAGEGEPRLRIYTECLPSQEEDW